MNIIAARHIRLHGLYFNINLSSCARAFGRVVSVQRLTPRHEDMRGSGGTAPQLLSLDTRYISYKLHAKDTFLLGKKTPHTHCTRGWVGSRAVLHAVVNRNISAPSGQSLSYPPPQVTLDTFAPLWVLTEIAARIFIILENFPKNCRPISVFYNVQL
jgi:hypothetical protein